MVVVVMWVAMEGAVDDVSGGCGRVEVMECLLAAGAVCCVVWRRGW